MMKAPGGRVLGGLLCAVETGRRFDVEVEDLTGFLPAVRAHRIVGRLIDLPQVVDDGPGAVVEALRSLRVGEVEQIERRLNEARDLTCILSRDGYWLDSPVVVLKGNSAAYNCGDRNLRRGSRDIDVIGRESARLLEALWSAGFQPGREGICHEETSMSRGDSKIDIHRYFPVWRYPTAAESARWPWVHSDKLSYEEIVRTSVAHPEIDADVIRIPGPTMSAFILCLHIFCDYVEAPYVVTFAKVRLVELLELRELWQRPDLDREYFQYLVKQHGADDAIRVAFGLLRAVERLSSGSEESTVVDFPRELAPGVLIGGISSGV